jgi:hypothetical protein
MSDTHLIKSDAAVLCGCSEDALRRDHRKKLLPNTEQREGKTHYAVADLVAIGRLDALRADAVVELTGRSRAERDLVETRQQLAVMRAERDAAVAFSAHQVE